MADENKNQDPEEEKNQASNDDDFGLPDFEFDALDDDDDDEEVSAPEEPAPVEAKIEPEVTEEPTVDDEDVPSLDASDLGDIDLEGIEDADLGDLEDLGDLGDLDLGDLDLDDLDLDNLDLDDLDKDLASVDEVKNDTTETIPEAASAERIEDIFDTPKEEKKEIEEPVSEIVDDGSFYEEESFEEFDMEMGVAESEASTSDADLAPMSDDIADEIPDIADEIPEIADESSDLGMEDDLSATEETSSGMDLGDDLTDFSEYDGDDDLDDSMFEGEDDLTDSSMFEGEDDLTDSSMFEGDGEGPDIEFEDDEAVPFAQRPLKGAEGLSGTEYTSDDDSSEEVSEEEAAGAKSKFVKIVVLGTVLFVAIGFGFLYLNGNFSPEGAESKNVAKIETEKPVDKTETKEDKPAEKVADKKDGNKADASKKVETKPVETKPKTAEKTTPKKTEKTTPKKTTTTEKKTPVANASGVTILSSKTGRQYLIVASFGDKKAAENHANKLATQGQSPTIIPPFDSVPNYRVAVASFAKKAEALNNLDKYRQQFGKGVWVLKY